jgi:subtilase family serine protease
MAHAYGFDSFHFVSNGRSIRADGSGQTIALIEAYHNPYLMNDLRTFDRRYGLSGPVVTQAWYGTQSNDNWAGEEMLDVEWAHALAPGAKILVVEARSSSNADLLTAINYARYQPGISVISMSFGHTEVSSDRYLDGYFTTPAGHNGITFVASSGDHGAWEGAQWPATSPDVVGVGGTSLSVTSNGSYVRETGWNNGRLSDGKIWSGGGGYSHYTYEPSYQYSAQSSGWRTVPDVAMDGDPYTGCMVYSTAPSTGRGSWQVIGGTSASAPMFGALIAIADQGRALSGKGTLDGASQTLPAIYSSLMTGDFRDVTSGYNGYYAGVGYDEVTGRGTPMAFYVVRDLMQVGASPYRAASAGSANASLPRGSAMPSVAETSTARHAELVVSRISRPGDPTILPDVNRATLDLHDLAIEQLIRGTMRRRSARITA